MMRCDFQATGGTNAAGVPEVACSRSDCGRRLFSRDPVERIYAKCRTGQAQPVARTKDQQAALLVICRECKDFVKGGPRCKRYGCGSCNPAKAFTSRLKFGTCREWTA